MDWLPWWKIPDLTIKQLMKYIPGPDFPTGGFIHGKEPIVQAYNEGKGIIQMRGKAFTETVKRTGKEQIVISEIPFMVNKNRIIEQIAGLVQEKKVEGIADLRDESDREGMRIVVELKRDAIADIVLNQLYKHTALQDSFGVNMLAIVDGQPKGTQSQRGAQSLLGSPQRSGDAAHRLRPAQGGGAAPYPRRSEDRPRPSRCRHRSDSPLPGSQGCKRRFNAEFRALRNPGPGDLGHAAAKTDRSWSATRF